MELTRTLRGDYGIRVAIELARRYDGGGCAKARELAVATHIPLSYTGKIMTLLARAGLVESRAGPHGGHRLAHNPAHITLLDVIDATDGPPPLARCVMRGVRCSPRKPCALHDAVNRAQNALRDSLRANTLVSLTRQQG